MNNREITLYAVIPYRDGGKLVELKAFDCPRSVKPIGKWPKWFSLIKRLDKWKFKHEGVAYTPEEAILLYEKDVKESIKYRVQYSRDEMKTIRHLKTKYRL